VEDYPQIGPAAASKDDSPFTAEGNLRLSIRMGLMKGLRLMRGLRRQLNDADRNLVAEAIREHLTLAGWSIKAGPGIGGHSQLSGGGAKRDHS
jgi:hypothetical protein